MCFNTVLMGGTGTGKTTKAKELALMGKRVAVYDVQETGDYKEFEEFDPSKNQDRCRVTTKHCPTYSDFMDLCESFFFNRGFNIILEESKLLFPSNQIDSRVNKFLLSGRHYLTSFLFMFHGADQIPPFIQNYCDIVVVKAVIGSEDHLKKKFPPVIYEKSLICRENPRKTFIIGISNKTIGKIDIEETFEGETIMDKILSGKIAKEANEKIKGNDTE